MDGTIMVSVISLCGTVIGSISGVLISNKLVNYRLNELEKKVDKHNHLIERMAIVERDIKTAYNQIDEVREDVKEIQHERMVISHE